MVKPAYMIAIAAVLLAASFAGVVLIDDEADAAEATSFQFADEEGNVRIVEAVDGKLTIPTPDALGFEVEGFENWTVTKDTTTAIFTAGSVISVSTLNTYADEDGVVKFIANCPEPTTIEFNVDGQIYAVDPEDAASALPKEVTDAIDAKVKAGFEFVAWTVSGVTDPIKVDAEATDYGFSVLDGNLTAGKTIKAEFNEIFAIKWVVDETTYVGNVKNIAQPADPEKDNYTFIGWAGADGKIAIKPGETLEDVSGIKADTTYTAQFQADMKYVTLMVGGVQYGEVIEVSYGKAINSVALPEGYAYWAVMTKAPVYAEDGVTIVTPAEYAKYDFSKEVTADFILYAIEAEPAPVIPDEGYDVAFVKMIDGETIAINTITITEQNPTVTIPTGDAIAVDGKEFIGWFVGTQQVNPATYDITEDVTFVAMYRDAPEPVPEEPAFYETNAGMIAIFLVIVVIAAFIYAYMTNAYGLKDKLSFKIVRNGGDKKE